MPLLPVVLGREGQAREGQAREGQARQGQARQGQARQGQARDLGDDPAQDAPQLLAPGFSRPNVPLAWANVVSISRRVRFISASQPGAFCSCWFLRLGVSRSRP